MNMQKGTIRYRYRNREYTATFRVGTTAWSRGLEIQTVLTELDHGWRLSVTLVPEEPVQVLEFFMDANYRFTPDDRIFCNGFQSWTESREFAPYEKIKKLPSSARRFNLHCFGDYHFYPYPGGRGNLHSHTYCYVRQKSGDMTIVGALLKETGYTIIACETKKNRMRIIKDVEGLEVSGRHELMDILLLQGPERDVLPAYFDTLCPGLQVKDPATGWTSWYNYYTDISEDIILENLNAFSKNKIPIDFFQIDDGYQTAVGDWLDIRPSFPRGMKAVADEIRKRGYRPGIWLAPFVCEERSKLIKEHPDWLLKKNGKPVPAGWNPNWSGTFYALDVYNDEFLYYIREVFDAAFNQWGFDMVKLDFLYAAAMLPRAGKTRGTVMADTMKFLRRCAGDRIILGCGVPMSAAFGMTDYCRIGSDVSPKWEDRLQAAVNYRERVSTVNSLASTVGRGHLNGRVFLNDPDVIMLRDEGNSMTPEERHTLFLLNNIFGGVLFTSDNIGKYRPETLKAYQSMFPFQKKEKIVTREAGEMIRISFRIGASSYVSYTNLSGHKAKTTLGDGLFFRSNGDAESSFVPGGTEITLAPHESRLFLAVSEQFFTVAGTSAHLFPGSEIVACVQKGDTIYLRQHSQMKNSNLVYIRTPATGQYYINSTPVQARKVRDKLFLLAIELEGNP